MVFYRLGAWLNWFDGLPWLLHRLSRGGGHSGTGLRDALRVGHRLRDLVWCLRLCDWLMRRGLWDRSQVVLEEQVVSETGFGSELTCVVGAVRLMVF